MTAEPLAAHVARADEYRTGRNWLRGGDPCRVRGERGVFRFVAHVTNLLNDAEWLEVVGPVDNPRSRAFRPDRVRRIARTTPMRQL